MTQDRQVTARARHLIERARLRPTLDLMHGDAQCIAIWSAAGTGKTTLLDEWARVLVESGTTVTRFTGDELGSWSAPPTAAGREHVVLVDDAHTLSRATAESLFEWVHQVDDARLIVAGRYQPLASLVHLASLGQLLELRTTDIAFSAEETAELAGSYGFGLPAALLESLTTRAGGWATGIGVVMPLLASASDPEALIERFVRDNRTIGDYLTAEVLDACTAQERSLLLATAVRSRVPIALAAELTRTSDAGAILAELAHRHMLLTADGDEIVFHPVLFEFLRAEARRGDEPAARGRHMVAARWFARHDDGEDALRHAVLSDDADLVRQMVGAFAIDLVLAGNTAPVLDALPVARASDRGLAEHCVQLLISLPFPDRLETDHLFRLADAASSRTPDPQWSPILHALHVLAARSTAQVGAHLAALTAPDGLAARRRCFGADLVCSTAEGWAAMLDGGTRWAIDRFHQVADSAHNAGYTWLALQASVFAADTAFTDGDWDGAAEIEDVLVRRAEQHSRSLGDRARSAALIVAAGRAYQGCLPLAHEALSVIAVADAARGFSGLRVPARALLLLEALDEERPRDAADELEGMLRVAGRGYPRLVAAALLRLVSLHLEVDGRSAARDFLTFTEPILGPASLDVKCARYLIEAPGHQGDAREEQLLVAAGSRSKSWHAGAIVGAWLLLSAQAETTGRRREADRRLEAAASHAKRYRSIRPFLARNGEGVALLESRIGHLGHLEEFSRLVVGRARNIRPALTPQTATVTLTRREHDILKELPQHQSLGEIARRHYLSTNTVKTHVRSIYQKLGVAERGAAVSAAREQGLL